MAWPHGCRDTTVNQFARRPSPVAMDGMAQNDVVVVADYAALVDVFYPAHASGWNTCVVQFKQASIIEWNLPFCGFE
jgi:hypothetical protein